MKPQININIILIRLTKRTMAFDFELSGVVVLFQFIKLANPVLGTLQ